MHIDILLQLAKEVTYLKTKVVTDTQSREIEAHHNKMIFILENRVEVASKSFNMVIADNTRLRTEIDTLLKERAHFSYLWNKLIGQLNTGKQVINDLIEQATITFNQRDEELNKIQALRERGIRDLKNHTSEMCELKRTLDNEMKLQEFLGVKGQFREMCDLNAKREAERQARREEKHNKIAAFTQILQTIKQFTGEEEINKLTTHFIKQEEENFALFNYVNELNEELETLQVKLEQLMEAIEETRVLNVKRDEQQVENLEKLTNQLKDQVIAADAVEEDLVQYNDIIDKLLRGIDNLFRMIRADNTSILELLGDNGSVNMSNVMLYLGIIEKRIYEMFHKVYWVDKTGKMPQLRLGEENKPRLKVPVLTHVVPTQPCALCVEQEHMQIVIEGLDAPLTRAEAMHKLQERIKEDYSELFHNVSLCHLPAARKIMQKRYQ